MNDAGLATRAPYRPDIDGLRALSVVAVVLFHAEVPGVAGGFVGVDVFFVISGYLITQWLVTREQAGLLALLGEFYVRRARRILPALLLMLVAATVTAWWLFLPADLVRFGKYLLGAVLMSGNLAAWTEGDYFNSAIGFAPLLHLWSIAVEEQFYLLFPLLMLLMRRPVSRRGQVAVLTVLAVGSFALCVFGSYRHPVANFYLGPTRAWELLLGALAAYGSFDSAARRAAAPLAATGFAAILAALILFRRELHYPGLATLVPALGTVALIVAGRVRVTRTARLLALRPCVLVGRASYSIYLWHLPPLVFATYWLVDAPRGTWRAVVLVVTLCVAFAAWFAFEEPLRRRRWLPRDAHFVAAMCVAFLALGVLGFHWWRSEGFPQRFSAAEQQLLAGAVLHRDAARCTLLSNAEIARGRICTYGPAGPDAANVPRALLWGDSHALTLLPAYEALADRLHVKVYFSATSACRPLPDYSDVSRAPGLQRACMDHNQAMKQAAETLRPDVVILGAFWAYPAPGVSPADGGPEVTLADALRANIRELDGLTSRVCLVRDVPVLRHPVPYALIMTHRRGGSVDSLALPDPEWSTRQEQAEAALSSLANEPKVLLVDPKTVLCPAGRCRIEAQGEVLYRDSNHLSVKGSLYVAAPLAECLANLR